MSLRRRGTSKGEETTSGSETDIAAPGDHRPTADELEYQLAKRKSSRKWEYKSAYGNVSTANQIVDTEPTGKAADPWDSLRLKAHKTTTAEEFRVEKRRRESDGRDHFRQKDIISSRSHPLVYQCRKLLREQSRKKAGVVRIEGHTMVSSCLQNGWVPDMVLADPGQATRLRAEHNFLTKKGTGEGGLHFDMLQVCSESVVKCVMAQPRLEPVVAIGAEPKLHNPPRPNRAMLLGVQDPSNLGSLIRSGAAYGVDTVYLLPGSPDPFNPTVLRASAGASMWMNYGTEEDAWNSKLPVVLCDAHGGNETLEGVNPGRFMLALGHETRGLPDGWKNKGRKFTLAIHIESLGVAAAGAIILDRVMSVPDGGVRE